MGSQKTQHATYNIKNNIRREKKTEESYPTQLPPQYPIQPSWSLELPILENCDFSIDITFDF